MKKTNPPRSFPHGFTIAIDGPVASGKGTIAAKLVKITGAINFNTGSMYRAVAYKCINNKVDYHKEIDVNKILKYTKIELRDAGKGNYSIVILDGKDITNKIFTPNVSKGSSCVAQYKKVREVLSKMQRKIAMEAKQAGKIVVMEGRDIGLRVLPDANLKVYLTAVMEIRAKRRLAQYKKKRISKTLESVISETKERDFRDMNRVYDPLAKNPEKHGYYILDNSLLTINETVDIIVKLIKEDNN